MPAKCRPRIRKRLLSAMALVLLLWLAPVFRAEDDNPEADEETAEEQRELKAALEEAYAGITLDGLSKYSLNLTEATKLLDAAGWKLNAQGKRTKKIDGVETPLALTLGMPETRRKRRRPEDDKAVILRK